MMRGRRSILLVVPLAAWAVAGCKVEQPASHGECMVNSALSCDSAVLAGNPDAGAALGLVGYACTGAARPDEGATYVSGIPYGMVCADEGVNADGTSNFCCTPPSAPVSCALDSTSIVAISNDPSQVCPEAGSYRFDCYGSDRPEALNPDLTCGNGIRNGQLVEYCCAGAKRPNNCDEAKGGVCTGGLVGWHCPAGSRPRGEDFGMSESRADYYYFVCGIPGPPVTDASGAMSQTFCCFTPSPVLPGGSCVTMANLDQIQKYVPGCTQGRTPDLPGFAFACYGRDTPEDDYTQIHCTQAPVDGADDNGFAAKVYCCDYRKPTGLACTTTDECQTHYCTEGYCCALESCPSCYSCGVGGVQGTCRLVPNGMPDPTGMCANGCDGMGNCLP
ncbi:MAG TPA: hypothetical protein VKQ32_16865 [Polyangia bacterium]|nr:hypothetical protein [Polyangia bacterium]